MAEAFNASQWLLDRNVDAGLGTRVAVRCQGDTLTYAELLSRVEATAAGFRQLGLRPEERIFMVLLDSVEFLCTFLGGLRMGAIPVPANPLLPPDQLAAIAADARAPLAVVSYGRAGLVEALREGCPDLASIVVAGGAPEDAIAPSASRWDEVLGPGNGGGDGAAFPTGPDSPGLWLCTSGTTGHPKLAMHRHIDLKVTADTYARSVLRITPEDRCYSVGPMFHAYGLGNSMTFPLSAGATTILEPTRPPTPALVGQITRREEPTLFFSIPTSFAALAASDLPGDTFRSVRTGVSAAEPLPAEIWRRFNERFDVEILDGIGSTEALHIFISNHPDDIEPGSSGRVVDGYDARIVDDDGGQVGPGLPGHLLIRGESLATGYWGQAAWSRQTFLGEWARTGDVYVMSPEGRYTYMGRSDDMMKVSGEWVSPAEVEAVLVEHPAVLESAVVGAVDDQGLHKPVAFVVLQDGKKAEPDELISFCRSKLAGYKCPRRFVVVSELPKTATGKIQRFRLRAEAST
jgi:benzoate-CoA ligase family protein